MSPERSAQPVHASGTFAIGGDLPVHRLGYGAMQILGAGRWGEPDDHAGAVAVLRRAVELGVDFIDTADSYGPFVSEDLIREALHPYGHVRIATKAGFTRQGPDQWTVVGHPAYLRQCAEMSLRRLGVETIDLYQLHRIDPDVPLEDQLGVFAALVEEGKVRHVGLSEVTVEELQAAQEIVPIATVQNLYNVANRQSEALLSHCEAHGIGFIPWFPVASGQIAAPDGPLGAIAERTGASPAQLSLAWLLRRSPVMLPIPGTKSLAHVEDNCRAAELVLDDPTYAELDALGAP
ncbi:aldo/keto reductase [Longivirga aurantiaca]|uniref:Aldo/keto reductase n=1 Tax=Longivirga aurantiaca TaxID=1837743 RepID=A0ABW1T1W2_9ACTN